MTGENLFEIATEFEQYGGKLLLIDEIHKAQDFSSHIKSIYDFLDLHVIFTGSSAMIINHESGDLSRRASMYYLPVMSLREFISLKEKVELPSFRLEDIVNNHEDISSEILDILKPLEHYSNYMQYGAYPFFKESISDYPMRLLEVINITIESDLAKIFNIDNEKQSVLKRVLGMLCSTSPYEISKAKLSKDTDISWSTLSNYLSYMSEGDFVVDQKYIFEIGGASKGDKQLNKEENSFVVRDDIETGYSNIIPLWLFGFLY